MGYQYLNGLDYITQEMDDWYLVSYNIIFQVGEQLTTNRAVTKNTSNWSKHH